MHVKICCRTDRGFAVISGLVGRAICFNEKVIPRERKGPGCRLFVHSLSFSPVIKAPGLMCLHVCAVCVQCVYRGDHGVKEMK